MKVDDHNNKVGVFKVLVVIDKTKLLLCSEVLEKN